MLSIQGYFGNDPSNLVNLNVIVGKIEKSETTITKDSTDENMIEVVGLDVMGGSHVNDPNIRIPCVLDAICPSEISEQDSFRCCHTKTSPPFKTRQTSFQWDL